MNLQEIAIFKRFIGQHELRKNFIKKYRRSIGMTRNPESIEQYLSNVEPEKVITSAVKHFITNEAMGYDFWQSVDISWQAYLHKMRSSHTIEHEDADTLRGYYSTLRENWDKEKPWIYEPISVAKLRYGLITEEDAEFPSIEPIFKVGDKLRGKSSGEVLEVLKLGDTCYIMDDGGCIQYDHQDQWELIGYEDKLINFSDSEDDDPLADFDFFDSPIPMNAKLKSDEVSLNFNHGSYKITFNKVATQEIKKSDMMFARLAKNKLGDICLILNRREGTRLSKTTSGPKDNITLNSKDICTKLRTLLNVKPDYSILNIEKLTSTSDYLIYKITKQ